MGVVSMCSKLGPQTLLDVGALQKKPNRTSFENKLLRIDEAVGGLCEKTKTEKPRIDVVGDHSITMFVATKPLPFTLILTNVLVEKLEVDEIEAAVAHEICHRKEPMMNFFLDWAQKLGSNMSLVAAGVLLAQLLGASHPLIDLIAPWCILCIAASVCLSFITRKDEYSADKYSFSLMGDKTISMLRKLQMFRIELEFLERERGPAMKWFERVIGKIMFPLSHHPTSDMRITRLEKMAERP